MRVVWWLRGWGDDRHPDGIRKKGLRYSLGTALCDRYPQLYLFLEPLLQIMDSDQSVDDVGVTFWRNRIHAFDLLEAQVISHESVGMCLYETAMYVTTNHL